MLLIVVGISIYYFTNGQVKKEKPISYNKDIRPLLSDRCFSCHGPDVNKMKAGLRLDKPEVAFAELVKNKGHYAIVPWNPEKSELIKRIESNDPHVVMPQPESHLAKLTLAEVEIFKRWIKEGAKYEKHWSFVAPIKTALPKIENEDWAKNEIDYSKTVIYKIVCKDLNITDCYVGNTTRFTNRKSQHKYSNITPENKSYNYNVYKFIRENVGW